MENNLFDKIVYATTVNIYSLSKDKNGIYFKEFDPNSIYHRYFLECALTASQLFNKDIYLDMSLFKYLLFKMKRRNKSIKRGRTEESIKIDEVLNFVANGFECAPSIFTEIYYAYYTKKGIKNESI